MNRRVIEMIKVVFSLAAIVIGLALIVNNFVRVVPEGEENSVGIVEYNIEQDSKIRNTEPYIQMGKELINLAMPDGFVDYRDSKTKSLEQLYEKYSSLDSGITLVFMGIGNDVVDFIRTNKGEKPKVTKLAMVYENDSKSAIFTPEILYKMEDAYKNEVLEFNKPVKYTEQGITIIEEELFQEKSEHPLYLIRVTKKTIKSNNQAPYLSVSCNPMVLINGKVFHLQVEREYDSQEDVDFVVSIAKEWGDKLLSIN